MGFERVSILQSWALAGATFCAGAGLVSPETNAAEVPSKAAPEQKPLKRWNNDKLALSMLVPNSRTLSAESLRKFKDELSHIPTAELQALKAAHCRYAICRGGWVIPTSISILPGISIPYLYQTSSEGLRKTGVISQKKPLSKEHRHQIAHWDERVFKLEGCFYKTQGYSVDGDHVNYLREGNLGKTRRNINITTHENGHAETHTLRRTAPAIYTAWIKQAKKSYQALKGKYDQLQKEAERNGRTLTAEEISEVCVSLYGFKKVTEYIAENFGAYVTSRETREHLKETDPKGYASIRKLKKHLRLINKAPNPKV